LIALALGLSFQPVAAANWNTLPTPDHTRVNWSS
jgi:hypothetical protein